MKVLLLILIALISYALGNLNGAILTSHYLFHKDVRKLGSGNAGLTNFYRSFGMKGLLAVFLVDALKTIIAVLIGGALMGSVGVKAVGQLFAGFCVMLGHCYPFIFLFKGGKGALCGLMMAFFVDWRVGLCCLVVFIVVLIFTRYVSLGSVLGAALFPIFLIIFGNTGLRAVLGLLCTLIIVIRHAENIVRLIGGTEPKFNYSPASKTDDFVDE